MGKKLNEMSLQELWELFPIFLVAHKEIWKEYYTEEKRILEDTLKGLDVKRIEHIGSTAIPHIYAKDIVDILIEVNEKDFNEAIKHLINNSYIKMNQNEQRASFNKGYTEKGFADKVFHIHLRKNQDIDEIYFRDYLIENLSVAKRYEELKLSLWKKYEHNRDGYTEAKTDFIKEITLKAKEKYSHR